MKEINIVRDNLMKTDNYTGYCGNNIAAREKGGCNNPRTKWDASIGQFKCPRCGWVTGFPIEFIYRYVKKWNKECDINELILTDYMIKKGFNHKSEIERNYLKDESGFYSFYLASFYFKMILEEKNLDKATFIKICIYKASKVLTVLRKKIGLFFGSIE